MTRVKPTDAWRLKAVARYIEWRLGSECQEMCVFLDDLCERILADDRNGEFENVPPPTDEDEPPQEG